MSKNHASPRSRARMHARARARGHHAWLARSTSRPCMHGAYAAVRRGACMLLVLTLRVNQQQDQRGRHRRSSLLRATHPPHPTYWLGANTSLRLYHFPKGELAGSRAGTGNLVSARKENALESAEKRSRITTVSKYGLLHDRLLLRSPWTESRSGLEPRNTSLRQSTREP